MPRNTRLLSSLTLFPTSTSRIKLNIKKETKWSRTTCCLDFFYRLGLWQTPLLINNTILHLHYSLDLSTKPNSSEFFPSWYLKVPVTFSFCKLARVLFHCHWNFPALCNGKEKNATCSLSENVTGTFQFDNLSCLLSKMSELLRWISVM